MSFPICVMCGHSRYAHFSEGAVCLGSPDCPCQIWDPGWDGHEREFREPGG